MFEINTVYLLNISPSSGCLLTIVVSVVRSLFVNNDSFIHYNVVHEIARNCTNTSRSPQTPAHVESLADHPTYGARVFFMWKWK